VTCEPFVKDVLFSDRHCVLHNEQMNASMDLKTLGQHGMMQVRCVKTLRQDGMMQVRCMKTGGIT
jgi:hypothetical protein